MKFKTLVYKFNTEYQEFVGYEKHIGWVTCSKPILFLEQNVNIEDIDNLTQFHNYDDLKLVTIEIKLYE
jgi:hypothetical protein